MTTAPEQISDTVAAITARLVARHDAGTVLRAVVDACASLLAADATGILVTDPRGGLDVVGASDQPARLAELLQAQLSQGPCVDCITDNLAVTSTDLPADAQRWPQFAPAAHEAGYRAVASFPLRLDGHAIGGVNLLYTRVVDLPDWQLRLGQALADLAVLGLTQERDQRRVERLAEQSLTTLNDRVLTSHAVGMLAAALDIEADDARALLATQSARGGRAMRELARGLTEGTITPESLRVEARPDEQPTGN